MSIFTCGICIKDYNDYNKKPLSLPCGHVFCEQCISKMFLSESMGMKCPSDNIAHKIEISKIPICAQILAHLPKQKKKTNIIHCMRHPNKKIKYFCRTHNVFPCSICVVEHTDHDIACFESNQSSFFSEIKSLNEQFNNSKEYFVLSKSKNDQNEKTIIDHFNIQVTNVERYFEKLYSLLKEKKRSLVSELHLSLTEVKKSNENRKKVYNKTNERFSELGNKMKHIEELYNKGEYEVFHLLKQKVINDLKVINTIETVDFNNELLPEYMPGQYGVLNGICGEIMIKISKIKKNNVQMGMNMNIQKGLVKEEEKEKDIDQYSNNEDTKSIDSMSTMMIIGNDTNNVFKQNLLKASENEAQYGSINNSSNDASTIPTNSNNQYNSSNTNNNKYSYQQYVSPMKPEQGVISCPMTNFKHNTPQTNRDIPLMNKPSQNNSDKKLNSIANNYNSNCNSINKNSHRHDGFQFNHQAQHKANIMNTSNTSSNKKEMCMNNEKNNNKNYSNNKRPRLKTENSLEKSNSKTNNDKGENAKYTPLVSSPGISETINKDEKANPKRQSSKKKHPNAFNAFCNVNSNININANNNLIQGNNSNNNKDTKHKGVNRKNSKKSES